MSSGRPRRLWPTVRPEAFSICCLKKALPDVFLVPRPCNYSLRPGDSMKDFNLAKAQRTQSFLCVFIYKKEHLVFFFAALAPLRE
jgi:hypothetical protein